MSSENCLASTGETCNTLVKIGKATAPPPSAEKPAIKLPKVIVRGISHMSIRRCHSFVNPMTSNQANNIKIATFKYIINDELEPYLTIQEWLFPLPSVLL